MDRRDRFALFGSDHRLSNLDERKMTGIVTVEDEEGEEREIEVPFSLEVCGTCEGKGSHVNPSIDSHGISAQEWAEDWDVDSRESYLSGGYDIPCTECAGKRVVPEPDLTKLSPEDREAVEDAERGAACDRSEREYEMRMGC